MADNFPDTAFPDFGSAFEADTVKQLLSVFEAMADGVPRLQEYDGDFAAACYHPIENNSLNNNLGKSA